MEAEDDLVESKGFISKGAVSWSVESVCVSLTILRDSEAKQILLPKHAFALLSSTFTGEFVVV